MGMTTTIEMGFVEKQTGRLQDAFGQAGRWLWSESLVSFLGVDIIR